MSFKTVHHSVLIDSDTLLDLFLGQAKLQVEAEGDVIFIQEINEQHIIRKGQGIQTHFVKICGTSSNPSTVQVGGTGTLHVPSSKNGIVLILEIHLEDGND